MKRVLHLTTHLNIGGITSYIRLITKEMAKLDYEFHVGSSGGSQEEIIEKEGAHILKLNIRTKSELSPKLYLALPKLIRYVKENKIQLVHAHTRVTQVLSWFLQRFTGIPYVSTCHGFYKKRAGRMLLPAWGDHVIAISNPVEDSLIKDFKVKPEKVSTIFNAIDMEDLTSRYRQKNPEQIRAEMGIATTSPVIGIVARVVPDKGHEYFLRAAQKLIKSDYPDIKLLIVGEGPHLNAMKALAVKLGIERETLFLGNLQDVTYALAITNIFVLPAIWREGFGLSIIEAMALKIPVVVTNIWSLNELVHNRVNGLLVEPKDVEDLEQAIRVLLKDKTLYEEMAQKSSETVRREFAIPQMAGHVDQLYRKIVPFS